MANKLNSLCDALDAAYPIPDNPHESVKQRASDNRTAFIQGWHAATEAAKAEPAEYKGWYCAHCQRGVDASEVTFHEQHTVCGRVITDDRPPAAKATGTAVELSQHESSVANIHQFMLARLPIDMRDEVLADLEHPLRIVTADAVNAAYKLGQDFATSAIHDPAIGTPEGLRNYAKGYAAGRKKGRAEAARQPAPVVLSDDQIEELARNHNLDGSMLNGSRMDDYVLPFARAVIAATNRSQP